jgi:hypothetical protein
VTGTLQVSSWPGRIHAPRGRVRADVVYLGWHYFIGQPDPGPMPVPPAAMELDQVSPDWLAAQRREQDLLARPARLGLAISAAAAGGVAVCWLGGVLQAWPALLAGLAGAAAAATCLREMVRGERVLRAHIRAERDRVRQIGLAQQAALSAQRAQHAASHRAWQQRRSAFRRQPLWYPATVPVSVGRIDVAGGMPGGWSALLTTIAAPRLAVGGAVTVLDLTEGGVAADLIALASAWEIGPLVWVLPTDLPRFDLGVGLGQESLAEVLALTAAAADPGGTHDTARDAALLGRLLQVLGPGASLSQLMAALRTLAQLGSPRQQLAGELSAAQLSELAEMAGRGAQQLLIERAWTLEARLRVLSSLGTLLPARPSSQLRVAWLGRSASVTGNAVLGSYLPVALTAELRQLPASPPWQQTVCVLGAERLPPDVLDRLCDAAEHAGAGLVLGYRSIPSPIRARIGRGNAAVAFMRLGNAEDARAAAEHIGTEHRFVVSQLTDTIGTSLTYTSADSYSSTTGITDSIADSGSATWTAGRGRAIGRSTQGMAGPLAAVSGSANRDASTSAAVSDTRSLTEGISVSTSWGRNTSGAVGANSSLAGTAQRSREFVVEQHELQHLPPTAVVLCRDGPGGRQVALTDANPAIMALPTATLASLPVRPQ